MRIPCRLTLVRKRTDPAPRRPAFASPRFLRGDVDTLCTQDAVRRLADLQVPSMCTPALRSVSSSCRNAPDRSPPVPRMQSFSGWKMPEGMSLEACSLIAELDGCVRRGGRPGSEPRHRTTRQKIDDLPLPSSPHWRRSRHVPSAGPHGARRLAQEGPTPRYEELNWNVNG